MYPRIGAYSSSLLRLRHPPCVPLLKISARRPSLGLFDATRNVLTISPSKLGMNLRVADPDAKARGQIPEYSSSRTCTVRSTRDDGDVYARCPPRPVGRSGSREGLRIRWPSSYMAHLGDSRAQGSARWPAGSISNYRSTRWGGDRAGGIPVPSPLVYVHGGSQPRLGALYQKWKLHRTTDTVYTRLPFPLPRWSTPYSLRCAAAHLRSESISYVGRRASRPHILTSSIRTLRSSDVLDRALRSPTQLFADHRRLVQTLEYHGVWVHTHDERLWNAVPHPIRLRLLPLPMHTLSGVRYYILVSFSYHRHEDIASVSALHALTSSTVASTSIAARDRALIRRPTLLRARRYRRARFRRRFAGPIQYRDHHSVRLASASVARTSPAPSSGSLLALSQ
ncbi:hypothetical protein B0H12DRAFT_1240384 [Mycena haematopus]|nr:hypothetical protein B0H12DRAFT_1240384 [Mycena haematopus]